MKALVVIFICTICTILYLLSIYYLRSTSNVDFKVWDIDTITVADYSIMVKITSRMWAHYQRLNGKEGPFDEYIKNKILE